MNLKKKTAPGRRRRVNGVFLLGCKLFFLETVAEWGVAAGFENVGAYMFLGLAGVNFLIEIGVNLILAPVIVRLIKIGKK